MIYYLIVVLFHCSLILETVALFVCVTQIFIVDGSFGFSEVGHFSKWLTLPISHAALSAHILKDHCNVHSVNAFGGSQQKEEKASVVWKSERPLQSILSSPRVQGYNE